MWANKKCCRQPAVYFAWARTAATDKVEVNMLSRRHRHCFASVALGLLLLLTYHVAPSTPSTVLHCGSGDAVVQPTPLPQNRTYNLRAEAKSGTTWFQQMIFEFLNEMCDVYDAIPNFSCRAVCEAESSKDVCPDERRFCPFAAATSCRTLRTTFFDKRSPDEPVVRHIRVLTANKHAIPFLSSMDHPNKTPVLKGTPEWLQHCVDEGNFNCVPPMTSLSIPLGLTLQQAREALAPVYPDAGDAGVRFRFVNSATVPTTEAEPQALLTIFRDPRSVTTSAAHYSPGANLFGVSVFSTSESVNTFVRGTINMTTAWTQFRSFWFDKLHDVGALPMYKTFYEELVEDTPAEIRRLAGFFGICYTEGVVSNVTHRNTQE